MVEGDDIMRGRDHLLPTDEDIRLKLGEAYEEIDAILRYYVDMNEDYYHLVTLWIMGTYNHSSFIAYPFLYLNAQRGSGKTRLLRLVSHLSKGSYGQVLTGVTESVLFRMEKGATMVLDECESIASKEKAVLREYLNASYKQGATVKRNKKVRKAGEESYEIETFEPYRPVALANIYGMNDVLGDRCLTLILEKSQNKEKTKLMEDFNNNRAFWAVCKLLNQVSVVKCSVDASKNIIQEWNNYIKRKYNYTTTSLPLTTHNYTTTLTQENNSNYNEIFNKIDEADINGRNLELVMPLFLLANFLSPEMLQKTIDITKRIMEKKRDEEFAEDKDVSLIDYVAQEDRLRFEYIGMKELTRQFRDFLGELDSEDNWLNARWVGNALKRLNLIGKKRRVARGIEVILAVDRAKEKRLMYQTDENKPEIK